MTLEDGPRVYRILPSWWPAAGMCFFGIILLQKNASDAILAHEVIHRLQQQRDGWKFYLRYVFSPTWRTQYEAEAYVVQYRAGASIEALADTLSGWLYLKCCSRERALRAIKAAAGVA